MWDIAGPWHVAFEAPYESPRPITLPTLQSLSENGDEAVKYFSGTAIYTTDLHVASDGVKGCRRLWLDLGDVEVIAEVELNGWPLGVLWHPPYRMDVTKAIRTGRNTLKIKVTNQWLNRVLGDRRYPDDVVWTTRTGSTAAGMGPAAIPEWVRQHTARPSACRRTFTGWQWPHHATKKPLPAGLIGPVRVVVE